MQKKIVVANFILALAFTIAATLIKSFTSFSLPFVNWLIIYFFALYLVASLWLSRVKTNNRKFFNQYFISVSIKLLIHLVLVLVFILNDKQNAVNFVVSFFVLYIAFTTLEVVFLVKGPKNMS